MPANQTVRLCTHIKPSGVRCGSPALRGEIFCYFHQRAIRGVRTPPKSRLHPIAILDDSKSIQNSIMEIINALVRNTIDYRRAQLILRALHMAAKNSRYAQFDSVSHRVVQEIPEYPAPREPRKPKRTAAPKQPLLPKDQIQDEEKPYYEQPWDWDEIRKKISDNTYYEPPRLRTPSPAPAAAAVDPTERKPPQSVKPQPQPNNSFAELATSILNGATPP